MCQLPDPPSEPLQTSRCNDGATLPLSMVGTASRTQPACAATWSQWSHSVATTAFAPPPSAPFPTTLLSCRSLAYSPTPTLPAAVRLGRQSTHNPHSIHTQSTHNPQLQTGLQCRVARLFTQALCSMFCMCLPLLFLLLLLLLLYMSFVASLSPPPSLPTRLLGFFLPGMLMTLAA